MRYKKLGRTDLDVSLICLGSMTWGVQNTESDAHEQLDYACAHGVNFIDTAEMYPVPTSHDTQGRTEEYIGSWLKKKQQRDKVIIATKVTGRTANNKLRPHLHPNETRLDRASIRHAIEHSLKRLNTDYVDLYQIHWPDRYVNSFNNLRFDQRKEYPSSIPIEETLSALGELVEEGKIRHVGVSNETPWGVMRYLALAQEQGLPRIASIQNPLSFLNRSFEIGISEVSYREDVSMLAYSPLGFGVLSGKYINKQRPVGARLTLFENKFPRFLEPRCANATERFVACAKEYGMNPAVFACAWVNTRPYMTSNIIGATSIDQLKDLIASADVDITAEQEAAIDAITADYGEPSIA